MKKDYLALNAHAVVTGKPLALRSAADAPALPQRIKIFDWGENNGRTTGARILVNEKTVSVLSANQESLARDTVALDYEHQTVEGHKAYQKPPHHVAAHGAIEVVEGEGVYLHSLSYTPNGEEFAANYPDVSPVGYTDKDDNLIFIHSVALTQAGDVAGLEFAEAAKALSAALNNPTQTQTPKMEDKYKKLIVELLGLKPADGEDTVTDEAIVAAVNARTKKQTAPADGDEPKALSAVNERLDQMERERLVDKAVASGKVIPLSAEQIKETPLVTLSAMIEKLPAGQVHTKQETTPETPATEVALSADDKALCQRLGISEDDFKAQL